MYTYHTKFLYKSYRALLSDTLKLLVETPRRYMGDCWLTHRNSHLKPSGELLAES